MAFGTIGTEDAAGRYKVAADGVERAVLSSYSPVRNAFLHARYIWCVSELAEQADPSN